MSWVDLDLKMFSYSIAVCFLWRKNHISRRFSIKPGDSVSDSIIFSWDEKPTINKRRKKYFSKSAAEGDTHKFNCLCFLCFISYHILSWFSKLIRDEYIYIGLKNINQLKNGDSIYFSLSSASDILWFVISLPDK